MDEDKKPSLESFLDIETIVSDNSLPAIVEEMKEEPKNHAQDDYDFARKQLRDLIINGTTLLADASNLASQGQQPEHFEVASNILGQMISANKELLGLSATHQKITGAGKQEQKVTNNNLFVGSPAELLKLMKKQQDGNS